MPKHSIKRFLSSILFLGIFVFTALPVEAQENTNKTSHYRIVTWKTTQGVAVYYVPRNEIPILDIAVIFAAGSAYDQNNWGLAYFTASMLGEGTKTRSANDIAKAFDSVGAQFGATADRDKAIVSLRTMTDTKYMQPALTTFLDVLTQPNFAANDFVRVQGQLFDAIRQGTQTPSYVASTAIYSSIYGNQPYGHPVYGTLETVSKLKNTDVTQFYQRFYTRQNARIVIVGAVSVQDAHQLAERIAAPLLNGQPAATLAATSQATKGQQSFIPMPVTQSTIVLGQNGIAYTNPDFFPLVVSNQVLGGASMTSVLFEQVRNKSGLVYGVNSRFMPLLAKGPFIVILQTRTEKTREALNLVNTLLQNYIQQGPTEAQLQATKMNLLGDFPIKMSTNSAFLQAVASIAFYNLPLDYLDRYSDNIKNVTVESAKNAFAHVVNYNDLNTVVVGIKNVR